MTLERRPAEACPNCQGTDVRRYAGTEDRNECSGCGHHWPKVPTVLALSLDRAEAQVVLEALDAIRDQQQDRTPADEAKTRAGIRRRLAAFLTG